jgi:hypothetical protein
VPPAMVKAFAAGGNGYPFAAASAIDQLNNVTVNGHLRPHSFGDPRSLGHLPAALGRLRREPLCERLALGKFRTFRNFTATTSLCHR